MTSSNRTLLHRTLADAQAELKQALAEACANEVERLDTGQLIRIEEVLAIANEAAKEAVTVRRRLADEQRGGATSVAATGRGVREIEDERGVRWAVFQVHPSSREGRTTVRERYRQGWLAFDSGLEVRRLAPIPPEWESRGDGELLELCTRAERAPRRRAEPTTGHNVRREPRQEESHE